MIGSSFWRSVRYLVEVYRTYDRYEYFWCDTGHRWREDESADDHCPECGKVAVSVQVDRTMAKQLGWQSLRTSIFPYRLSDWTKEPKSETTWYWRRRRLFSYMRDNPFYGDGDLVSDPRADALRDEVRQILADSELGPDMGWTHDDEELYELIRRLRVALGSVESKIGVLSPTESRQVIAAFDVAVPTLESGSLTRTEYAVFNSFDEAHAFISDMEKLYPQHIYYAPQWSIPVTDLLERARSLR